MAVRGVTFDEQLITSGDMASLFYALMKKKSGIINGCSVSYSGSNLYVTAGKMVSHGRLSVVSGTETIPAPAVSSGSVYCRLVYEIDLSRTNTESEFNQGFFKILQNATAYPEITQEDLDAGGTVYDLPIARFRVSNSGIESFVSESVPIVLPERSGFVTVNGTEYQIVTSTTDAGQAGKITIVI